MKDQWDEDTAPGADTDEPESAAGELKPINRFAMIGVRTTLMLGMAAVGAAGLFPHWPSVSSP
jgi:hypothetical protein